METGTCKCAIKITKAVYIDWKLKSKEFFKKTKCRVSTAEDPPPPLPRVVQAVETRRATFQQRGGSAPDVGLFNTPPSCVRGKDAAGTEGDGKHKANLQDLNCGFRFLP